jgi:hypothetical protein
LCDSGKSHNSGNSSCPFVDRPASERLPASEVKDAARLPDDAAARGDEGRRIEQVSVINVSST